MALRFSLPLVLPALLLGLSLPGCRAVPATPQDDPAIRRVEEFRVARADGRLEEARSLLTEDPRIWYDERKGEGSPWRLGGGGRWKAWDTHFGSRTMRVGPWHVEGDTVWADMHEVNDYFRLTERGGGFWRATYVLAEDGRIAGFLVSGAPGRAPARKGLGDEFERWAFANEPDEAEYLMPGGSIDPTGDRPPRMRALLERWRAATGRPPLEG